MIKSHLVSIHSDERLRSADCPRRILVTGGAGFVGSHLCDAHLQRGDEVVCLDDFTSGRPMNISHVMDHPRFSFRRHDVSQPYTVEGHLDVIYNLACPASPPKCQLDPIKTLKTCILGAEHALQLAVAKGAVVLQASTSEVYGDPDVTPQPEGYHGNVNTFAPRVCYDEAKRAAETLVHSYHAKLGARIRVARIFNTYGPRIDPEDGCVVSNFICQALEGDDITIYGDGFQTQSFCFIEDLVRGIVALADAPDTAFEPLNLGNQGEFSIRTLAQMVLEKVPGSSRLVGHELPVDDPKRRKPDITRAHRLLNWQPWITLEDVLDRTFPYLAEELAARNAGRVTEA